MFSTMAQLLDKAGAALVITVVADGKGELEVAVIPKGTFKESALGVGLKVKGTPEALDADLAGQLARYVAQRSSLAEQVDATLAVLQAAQEANKGKAVKAVKAAGERPAGSPAPAPNVVGDAKAPAAVSVGGDDDNDEEMSLF